MRIQLALNVSDLDAAVEFYSKMFGVEVNKRMPGYANFAIAEPPLKLVLFALPFLRYVHFGDSSLPHADHAPRNGGVLRMVGDHHLEVRRRLGRIEVFVSDAVRTPVQARAGWVSFAGAEREPLRADRDRLTGPDRAPDRAMRVEIEIELDDGDVLSWDFGAVPASG